jgi:hypothetical protein
VTKVEAAEKQHQVAKYQFIIIKFAKRIKEVSSKSKGELVFSS